MNNPQLGAWYNPLTWGEDTEEEKAMKSAEVQQAKAKSLILYAIAASILTLTIMKAVRKA